MDFYKLFRVEPTILIICILVNCPSLQNQLAPPIPKTARGAVGGGEEGWDWGVKAGAGER